MTASNEWWRTAVIYQIYPRSFADGNGDGIGDLAGITGRLDAVAELGADAIWLSPFFTSPQRDAGYDVADYCDVDPLFGTLADFDAMRERAHALGLKVIVDLVPNHSSSDHPWFQDALAAAPDSGERGRYIFREGRGDTGELPPNNWQSVFGGDAWTRVTEPDGTPGQWYLHLFDSSQPDFDWTNEEVRKLFRAVLRFWLDRGVDGFRVDVAHGLAKVDGLPDYTPPADSGSMGGDEPDVPYWAQDGVHEIFRDWRRILDEYEPARILAGEAWVQPISKLANWVRPDEMHQTFNFGYLETAWDAGALRAVVDSSLDSFGSVGAPSTWVLSNHDVIRHTSRLALTPPPVQGSGIGPRTQPKPDAVVGLRRARAATAFMLGLPGSSYLYQGEELGLPEVADLPDEAREDPTFLRTGGELYGRDGCRVPLPWEAAAPGTGFSTTGASWLPQPAFWPSYARDAQRGIPGSTLEFYREALAARRAHGLGSGALEWVEGTGEGLLAYRNGDVLVIANVSAGAAPLLDGEVITASGPLGEGVLPGDTTVWLRAPKG
ncbi:glycoside hydrolase family 13 protein [Homoserinibacter sp. YIM 151385]|uniref:glycoside hydrolase family 13 protein n=1 Tax=Homoserinibacter sp. YIM 151385 TaxID=2985506 RepID=UPI0022F0C42C|nr:glycoside hydrolase family 13 protein [Homoserinibacter sp. YIM 151385]WBU36975.1 glycoside hydrolase family 13 protein [Homoserinibacter sp. YIM 151385]